MGVPPPPPLPSSSLCSPFPSTIAPACSKDADTNRHTHPGTDHSHSFVGARVALTHTEKHTNKRAPSVPPNPPLANPFFFTESKPAALGPIPNTCSERPTMQAHVRSARVGHQQGAGPFAPPARPPRAHLPAAAASPAPAPAARGLGRPRLSLLARAAPPEGGDKKGEAAAPPATAAAPPTPPAGAVDRKGDGLDYVAHPFGQGRLSSDDEDGAFWITKTPGAARPLGFYSHTHAHTRSHTHHTKTHTQTSTCWRSRRSGTCSRSGERERERESGGGGECGKGSLAHGAPPRSPLNPTTQPNKPTRQTHSDSPFVVNNNTGGGFGASALVIGLVQGAQQVQACHAHSSRSFARRLPPPRNQHTPTHTITPQP
jgi:hypothetical protein